MVPGTYRILCFFIVQLLKKPDKGDDADPEKSKEKSKKPEKPVKEDKFPADHKRRDNKDDRGRK